MGTQLIKMTKRLAQIAMSKKVNCQQELPLRKVLIITITRRSLLKEACQCLLKVGIRVKWQEPAPERKKTKNVLDLGIVCPRQMMKLLTNLEPRNCVII